MGAVDIRANGPSGFFRRRHHARRREATGALVRLDWLTLLPAPRVADPVVVVLGDFGARDRARIAEHFGVERAHDEFEGRTIDVLIVIDEPARRTIEALGSLAVNGIACVAGRRRDRIGLIARAGRARAGGFHVVSAHWMMPRLAAPRRFVPLGGPEPLGWYLDNLFGAGARSRRRLTSALGTFAGFARWLAPHQLLVISASSDSSDRLDLLESALGVVDADDVEHVIVMTSGFDAGSRTVVLPFGRGSTGPLQAIKLAGHPSMNDLTDHEQRALEDLRSELPSQLAPTIPVPLGRFGWRGRMGGIESVLDGPTLDVALRDESSVARRIDLMREVARWVGDLHRATSLDAPWDEQAHDLWVQSTIRDAQACLADADSLGPFFGRLEAASVSLRGSTIPLVRRHFDLGPWNIIKTVDGLGVIDWEDGLERSTGGRGLPLCDLDYFVKYWLHVVCDSRRLDDELDLFAWFGGGERRGRGVDQYRRAAQVELDAHIVSLAIDRRFVPVLVAQHWIEHAVNTIGRATATGDRRVRTASAESYLRVLAEKLEF